MARKRKAPAPASVASQPQQQESPVIEQPQEQQEDPPQQTHQEEHETYQIPTEENDPETMDDDEDEENPDEEDADGENPDEENPDEENPSLNDALSSDQQPEVNGNGEKEEEDGEDEDQEADEEEEPIEKLLEPFSKDQLVILLKEAVTKYPELIENVEKFADVDPAHRKIFIHGFGWDITADTLTSVFKKFGEIEDCKAVTDKISGKSKGYGFILFKHRSGARKALRQPQKKIGNRMTSCQLASAGPVPAPPPVVVSGGPPVSEYTQRKIFVSNVAPDIEPQKLLEFFGKFGEIEDGPLGLDKATGKPKGFALFVYKSTEGAKKALEEPHKSFEGHTLHVQKAIDGPKHNKQNYHQQQQHHGHGHGQYHHHHAAKKGKYASGGGGSGSGHLMAPSGPPAAVGYNPSVAAAPALTPALGQALTAFLATQGAGLGIQNLIGGMGGPMNQGVPPVMNNAAGGYGNQGGGGYGGQMGMQGGGYQNPQMGQGGNRPQQGGPPYMGRGH